MKKEELQTNVALQQSLDDTRRIVDFLESNQSAELESRLLSSTSEFFKLVEEIDRQHFDGVQTLTTVSTIDRLRKTQAALNEEAKRALIERYGFANVQLENIEDIYRGGALTGLPNMQATRRYLIQRGMT
jgi:hypothetical protein